MKTSEQSKKVYVQQDWVGDLCSFPGCVNPLPLRLTFSRGRPPAFCSDACKMKAYRQRVKTVTKVSRPEETVTKLLYFSDSNFESGFYTGVCRDNASFGDRASCVFCSSEFLISNNLFFCSSHCLKAVENDVKLKVSFFNNVSILSRHSIFDKKIVTKLLEVVL